ncbi:MAG: methyltransferase domain-containing protein, partial [Bacteroidia bacterium]
MKLNEDYWSFRYQTDQIGWDLGVISTPLKQYIDQLENKSQSILIPGCGNAYEAEYLLNNGFKNVTLVDISNVLIEQLKERFYPDFEGRLNLIHGDFFEISGQYDLIIEQTFFCALDPQLRNEYADKMNKLLVPNGKLVGVMFNRQFEKQGPPFGGTKDEYIEYFDHHFKL